MTRAELEQYFRLEFELEERGRLDPTDAAGTPRWDEYQALKETFERTFQDYGEGLIMDESPEMKLCWDHFFASSDGYRQSLKAIEQSWRNICDYWKDRAETLAAELKAARGEGL